MSAVNNNPLPFPYKRTFDSTPYLFDCQDLLLDPAELILSSPAIVVLSDEAAGVTFGTPTVLASDYQPPGYNRVIPAGKGIQVQVSGGTIPATQDDMNYGVPNYLLTLRAKFATNINPNQDDATSQLLLIDKFPRPPWR